VIEFCLERRLGAYTQRDQSHIIHEFRLMSVSNKLCRSRGRSGLTVLEFLGCSVALVGGAWLGAIYLGVDVQNVAYTALSQAQVLDKMPDGWRPKAPAEKTVTREQLVNTLREELGMLRTEITALRSGKAPLPSSDPSTLDTDPISKLPTKERTLAYWARLSEIALGEATLQQDAEQTFNEANAAKVFAIKGRISRFSAKAVESIPTLAVDEAAVRFGRELGLWYDHAGELYEKAVRIWETPIAPQARTELNVEWKQAQQHHQNEAQLLHKKAAAVRGSISRIYGQEFPEFAKPAASAEKVEPVASTAT
jgi:hypothetical protein